MHEPKPLYGARDAKAMKNFLFYLEKYSRAKNTVTKESKITLMMMHLQRTISYDGGPILWTSKMLYALLIRW